MIYKNTPNLVLLKINPTKLTAPVKNELADNPRDVFPHLYGKLVVDAVESTSPYAILPEGVFPKVVE